MRKLATFDTETDPFEHGVSVKPFSCGFYDGENYWDWWGDDCIQQFFRWLDKQEIEYRIYVHNGGNFDFYFMLEFFEGDLFIRNRRIAQAWHGKQEFRDSYAIIPEPLSAFKGKNYQKQEIDYALMKRGVRELHQHQIRSYQKDDCRTLYEGVQAFFVHTGGGDFLTVGMAAMKFIKKLHPFESGGTGYDEIFRPFYFGGRCQCFRVGMVRGKYKIFDINSQYPHVMRAVKHPISIGFEIRPFITNRTTFAVVEAKNYGALAVRTREGIDFTKERGVFYASIHELQAGEETGTLEVLKVKRAYEHKTVGNFADYVDYFMSRKIECETSGDALGRMINKRLANSGYGKFAQDPRKYCDHCITHDSTLSEPWKLAERNGSYFIWEKPGKRGGFYNVATAASITGAARAMLLRALAKADDPIYCDTDSIICRSLDVEQHATKIGAWKCEGQGTVVALAGKKMYVVIDEKGKKVKQANKGARLEVEDIVEVAKGKTVRWTNPVPRFHLDGRTTFVSRRIAKTAKLGSIGRRKPARQMRLSGK